MARSRQSGWGEAKPRVSLKIIREQDQLGPILLRTKTFCIPLLVEGDFSSLNAGIRAMVEGTLFRALNSDETLCALCG